MTAFLLKSAVSANTRRAVIGRRSRNGETLLMCGCAVAAFLFVSLVVAGIF